MINIKLSIIALFVVLQGCSSMGTRDIDTEINSNTSFYKRSYSENVLKSIELIQANRAEKLWEEGPTFLERTIALSRGIDPYIGWSPKINNTYDEERTKEKYQDAFELSLLFDDQPVEVLVNDQMTLVTMPQNWVWTFSNQQVNDNAERYIKKAIGLLNPSSVRYSVYSQEGFKEAQIGKQWRSQAKSNRFKDYLVDKFQINPKEIQAFGLGNKISSRSSHSKGDSIQLVIYYKFDVDSSRYLSN